MEDQKNVESARNVLVSNYVIGNYDTTNQFILFFIFINNCRLFIFLLVEELNSESLLPTKSFKPILLFSDVNRERVELTTSPIFFSNFITKSPYNFYVS